MPVNNISFGVLFLLYIYSVTGLKMPKLIYLVYFPFSYLVLKVWYNSSFCFFMILLLIFLWSNSVIESDFFILYDKFLDHVRIIELGKNDLVEVVEMVLASEEVWLEALESTTQSVTTGGVKAMVLNELANDC
jgi:hypothetical protein